MKYFFITDRSYNAGWWIKKIPHLVATLLPIVKFHSRINCLAADLQSADVEALRVFPTAIAIKNKIIHCSQAEKSQGCNDDGLVQTKEKKTQKNPLPARKHGKHRGMNAFTVWNKLAQRGKHNVKTGTSVTSRESIEFRCPVLAEQGQQSEKRGTIRLYKQQNREGTD